MARKAKELGALEVSRLTKPGLFFVGGVAGLALQVTERGARTWILRIMIGGKRRDMGLGGYPDVTLASARERARVMREKVDSGVDPILEREQQRSTLAAAVASAMTFKEAAEKYVAAHEAGWKNAKHAEQWINTLTTYAFPIIGRISVSDIEMAHVMRVIEPIWTTKTETASRVRGRIESVLGWATVRGYRKGDNPERWRGHLEHLLPARSDVKKVEHHPALDYRQIGEFMSELRKQTSIGARALEFLILTALRSGVVRGAIWQEIDWEAEAWIIPGDRMKAKKEHRVPLSKDAIHLLKELPWHDDTDLIFASSKKTILSDMTLTATIKRMDKNSVKAGGTGWKDRNGEVVTAHGFRSTFRDWAGETTAYPREVIEHAMAHQLPDKAEAAYARGSLFNKRRRLMADWASFCATDARVADVTPINRAAS